MRDTKNTFKRIVSAILLLCMVFSIMPDVGFVFAKSNKENPPVQTTQTGNSNSGDDDGENTRSINGSANGINHYEFTVPQSVNGHNGYFKNMGKNERTSTPGQKIKFAENRYRKTTAMYMFVSNTNEGYSDYQHKSFYCIQCGEPLSSGQLNDNTTPCNYDYITNSWSGWNSEIYETAYERRSSNNITTKEKFGEILGLVLSHGYNGSEIYNWYANNFSGSPSDALVDACAHAMATQILVWETELGERKYDDFSHIRYTRPNNDTTNGGYYYSPLDIICKYNGTSASIVSQTLFTGTNKTDFATKIKNHYDAMVEAISDICRIKHNLSASVPHFATFWTLQVGSESEVIDSSTTGEMYNNFTASERIHWDSTTNLWVATFTDTSFAFFERGDSSYPSSGLYNNKTAWYIWPNALSSEANFDHMTISSNKSTINLYYTTPPQRYTVDHNSSPWMYIYRPSQNYGADVTVFYKNGKQNICTWKQINGQFSGAFSTASGKGTIQGYKYDGNNNKLANAVIGLFDTNTSNFTAANAIATSTTNANGLYKFTDIWLGDYIVHEISAPTGYVASQISIPVKLESNGQTVSITTKIENPRDTRSLKVQKVNENGVPLAGVQFYLRATSSPTSTVIAGPKSTDAQGIVVFDNIPLGTYWVHESSAPAGYTLASPQQVTISNTSPNVVVITVTNVRATGTVSGYKAVRVNSTSTQPLAGAVFSLRHPTTGATLYTAVSGADGSFVFTNVEYGTYKLYEDTPPNGYLPIQGAIQTITVSANTPSVTLGTIYNQRDTSNDPGAVRFKKNFVRPDGTTVNMLDVLLSYTGETLDTMTTATALFAMRYAPRFGLFPIGTTDFSIANASYVSDGMAICLQLHALHISPLSSTSDAYFTFTNASADTMIINPGTYILAEIYEPQNGIDGITFDTFGPYQRDTRTVTVTVTGGQITNVSYIFRNTQLANGNITINKADQEGNNVVGATFGLYDELPTSSSTPLTTAVTNANGVAQFTNLEAGEYWVKEISAPSGYTIDTTIQHCILGEYEGMTNGVYNFSWTFAYTAVNTKIYAQIEGYKYDSVNTSKRIQGAIMGLYNRTTNELIQSTQTNANGEFTFYKVPVGSYYVQEIAAPTGYVLNTTKYYITVSRSTTYYVNSGNGVPNVPIRGKIQGVKINQTGDKLEGAVFGLYTTSEGIATMGTGAAASEGTLIATATSNNRGIFIFNNVPYGNYYVQEISAPSGYISLGTKYYVSVLTNGTLYYINDNNPIENPPVLGTIIVHKTDENNEPLDGAKFGLFNSSTTIYTEANALAVQISDDEGEVSFIGLTLGTYTIVELEAPDGYTLDSTPHTVTVSLDTPMVTLNVENVPANGVISGIKVDDVGNRLAGATFGLFDKNRTSGWTIANALQTAVTNTNGEFEFTGLAFDTYKVREISAPSTAYTIDATVYTVTISQTNQHGYVNHNDPIINLLKAGSAYGIKTDNNGTAIGGAVFGLFPPRTEVFTINNVATDKYGNPLTATSSAGDGRFDFTNVPFGEYICAEITAPEGYILNTTTRPTVTINSTTRPVNMGTWINEKAVGTIIGYKVDENNNPLADATFGLYSGSTKIAEAISDNTGTFTFTDIDFGTYTIREISAPAGYQKRSTTWTVTLDENNTTVYVNNGTAIANERGIAIVWGRKVGEDGNRLNGAKFGLFPIGTTSFVESNVALDAHDNPLIAVSQSQNEPGTGNLGRPSNGVFIFNDVLYGSYILREIEAPSGYNVSTNQYEVNVNSDTVYQLGKNSFAYDIGTITNYLTQYTGTVMLRKYDDHTHALNGAVFQVFAYDDTNLTAPLWTAIAGEYENGVVAFHTGYGDGEAYGMTGWSFPRGKYRIVEISAPEGYMLTPPEGVAGTGLSIEDGHIIVDVTNSDMLGLVNWRNHWITGSVIGTKVDVNGSLLPDAVFGLFPVGTTEFIEANVAADADDHPLLATSQNDGTFAFSNVPYGQYILREITPPTGYEPSEFSQTITIETDEQIVNVGNIVNTPILGTISIHKEDADGHPLSRITFGLFHENETVFTTSTAVMVESTDADGNAVFTNVPVGSYIIKELETLDYLVLLNNTFGPYTIDANHTEITVPTITNQFAVGTITGRKVDDTGRPLANVVFGLYTPNDTAFETPIATATTNSNGNFTFPDVRYGSYVVKEMATINGYVLNNTTYPVTVNATTPNVNIGNIVNQRAVGSIIGYKVNENNEPIQGVTFTLYDDAPTFTHAWGTAVTDTNGKFEFTNVPFGTYQVRETATNNSIYELVLTPYTVTIDATNYSVPYNVGTIVNPFARGSINGTKVDTNGALLQGAVFGLFASNETVFDAEHAIDTAISNANGVFEFTDVIYGTYIVRELVAPYNHVPNTTNYPVSVSATTPIVSLGNIVNELGTGNIVGQKTDGDGNPLANAWFGLYTLTETEVARVQSDTNGIISFNNIPYGTYIVKEISAPAGYIASNDEYTVTISEDGQSIDFDFENPLITGTVNGTKVDDLGNPVKGVVFGLFSSTETTFTETNAIYKSTTNSLGEFRFENVPYGAYQIAEISVPNGYILDQTPQAVNITTNGITLTYSFTNPRAIGTVTGVKKDDHNNTLAGAVFGLFPAGTTDFENTNPVKTATSNTNGVFTFTEVPFGTYVLAEISAPAGYTPSTAHPTVIVNALTPPVEIGDIINTTKTGTIIGTKLDEDNNPLSGAIIGLFNTDDDTEVARTTTLTDGTFSFNNIPYGNYYVMEIATPNSNYVLNTTHYPALLDDTQTSVDVGDIINDFEVGSVIGRKISGYTSEPLAGATFGLFPVGTTVFDVAHTVNGNTTAVSGSNGVFTFSDVRYGNYIVREITAPTNYTLNTTEYPVTVNATTPNVNIGDVINTIGTGTIIGHKVDDNNTALEGAVFGLYDASNTKVNEATSNAQGVFTFTNVPYGVTFTVKEISAPTGYLPTNTTATATVTASQPTYEIIVPFENPHIVGSVTGHKVDDSGNDLGGATFILKQGNVEKYRAISNAQGVFTFTNVIYGTYTLVELEAPAGYAISSNTWEVSITTNGQVVTIAEDIENELILNGISGMKYDNDGNPLAGATFGLFPTGTTTFDVAHTLNGNTTAVSGANGMFTFANIPSGTYVIAEITAPTGYIKSTVTQTVTLNDDGTQVPAVANIAFENTQIKGTITGTKKDDTGTIVPNTKFGLFSSTESNFTEANALQIAITNASGVFAFNDVPYGTYKVVELSVPTGYVLDQTPQIAVINTNGETVTLNYVNDRAIGSITGTKHGETSNPLAGVVFGLFAEGTTTFTGTPLYTATTQADGTFTFIDIPFGTYIVHEVSTIDHYTLSNRSVTVTINETNYTVAIDTGIWTNTLTRGSITGIKNDGDGNPLEGAVFGLFPTGTTVFDVAHTVNGNTTATSTADGTFTFNDVVDGSYIVRELTAPTGYELNTTEYPVTLLNGTANTTIGPVTNPFKTTNITGTKVGPSGEKLANAVFGLFPAGTTVFDVAHTVNGNTTATSNTNGVFTFTNVRYGTYIVREISAPANYTLNTTQYPVTVDDSTSGATINIGTVVNELGTAGISGIKYDNEGNPLAGATFGLFPAGTTVFDTAHTVNGNTTAVSGTNGIFTFSNVSYGDYIVAEIEAPAGYIKSDVSTSVSLTEANGQVPAIATLTFNNTLIVGRIYGNKVDDANNKIEGVVFGLFDTNTTSYTLANALYTATTNANGDYEFTNIPYGTYKLVEISVPAGYIIDQTPTTVTITTNGEQKQYNFTNQRILGTITGTKIGENGEKLSGAVFTLQPLGWTATTNAQGVFTFENVPYGSSYTVVETTPPTGYVLDSTPYPVTIDTHNEVVSLGDITNTQITGTITGVKVGENGEKLEGAVFTLQPLGWTATTNAQGVFTFENVPYGEYTIVESTPPTGYNLNTTPRPVSITTNGETVTVGNIENTKIKATIVGTKKGSDGILLANVEFALAQGGVNKYTAITNENGVFTFTNVEFGTYSLIEIAAPEGYIASNALPRTITVDTNGATIAVGDIINEQIVGTVFGRKVDADNNPLSGAVFGLFRVGTTDFQNTTPIDTAIAGTNGVFTFNDVPYGHYIVGEISAPDGYMVSSTGYPVTINEMNDIVNIGDVVNYNALGTITGTKEDSNGNKLQYAPFGLFSATETTDFTAENALQIAYSDANGVFTFTNVPYGTYKVREIIPESPEGILAWRNFKANNPTIGYNTTVYEVEITPAGGQNVTITVINPPLEGTVQGIKVDENGDPLQGASIGLYRASDDQLLDTQISGVDGTFSFGNYPYGSYYLQEIDAPSGYEVSNTKYPVTIDDHLEVITITIHNYPSARRVEVTKRIKAEDINWANGNPIFIFKLATSPVSSVTEAYYLALEFTQAYVEANTGVDGYVEMTGVFENLAPDQYILTELDTMRYQFEGIDQVVNGTAVLAHPTFGNCVVFDLSKKEYGAARFTNVKTRWDYSTDTDVVVNEIGH